MSHEMASWFEMQNKGECINFTAGLPIVRTSPDHGTAFDIAGKDLASEQSMRNAIYLAIDIYRNRQFIKEMVLLRFVWVD